MTETNTAEPRDYRETLFLPKTDFPMRAGLPKKEPEWLERWKDVALYEKLRAQSKGRKQWTLHDGPPYANGHIHMGTAMNKILKDIINRSHQMLGYDAHYVPGWDCHGLPIEWKVEEEFRSKGRAKDDVPPSEFRSRCREYAAGWLDVQREEFKRLGVVGDWDDPYKTMNFQSESDICGELLKIAKTGQLYRGSKPVMWSPVEQTALAEAEVEYADRKATQIYVKFPVRTVFAAKDGARLDRYLENSLENSSVVIWTTTPWTIPANRAVSFSPSIEYIVVEVTELDDELAYAPWVTVGEKLCVAQALLPELMLKTGFRSYRAIPQKANPVSEQDCVFKFPSSVITLDHPLKNMDGADGKYDFPVPLLEGSHVTADAGTGFVHTAPSHGEDDYVVWISNQTKLEAMGIDPVVPMTMDDSGCYTDVMPERFQGLDVIRTSGKKRGQDGKANGEVLKALVECGNLLARGVMTLRDAHSWRSKAPVIRRATPQWFISMSTKTSAHPRESGDPSLGANPADMAGDGFPLSREGTLREKALAAIEETGFYPPRGRNRLEAMIKDRPDWLISRQRAWGVPITLIVDEDGTLHTERDDADAINARILAAVEKDGVDGWFETPLENFMPEDNEGWTKVTDILDVWFDSGCTHAFCLKRREDLPDRADLYLEGSDQHRGWFQSSLLESCAVYGEAPYDNVLTHGFVVDSKGYKESKSLGNTTNPADIIRQSGAEIIRLWTASSDFTDDLRVGKEIIQTSADAYRKMRNTLRYMIGALDGYDAADAVDYVDMPALEKWALHRLHELDAVVHEAYREFDLKKVFSALFNFCTVDLSAFYFDIRKDALYCDPTDSTRRRACRTVMDAIFVRLTTWLAPIMCFTMEEVWQTRFPSKDGSVHLEVFPETPDAWKNDNLAGHMDSLRDFRAAASEAIEPLRKEKIIKSSLEAHVIGPTNDGLVKALSALGITRKDRYADPANPADTLADYLIVSVCELSDNAEDISVLALTEKAGWAKCERSWKYFKPEAGADITPRDAAAVSLWDSANG